MCGVIFVHVDRALATPSGIICYFKLLQFRSVGRRQFEECRLLGVRLQVRQMVVETIIRKPVRRATAACCPEMCVSTGIESALIAPEDTRASVASSHVASPMHLSLIHI